VYIADCEKSHISKWPGSTRVAGLGKRGKTLNRLQCPSSITIDRDGTVFIADTDNHRIMHWQPNAPSGVCLAGCSTIEGNTTDELAAPRDHNLIGRETCSLPIRKTIVFNDLICTLIPYVASIE
jgi:hypothetical protein